MKLFGREGEKSDIWNVQSDGHALHVWIIEIVKPLKGESGASLEPVKGLFFMSLSKKIRFEVFKRDSFKCQYCGATPPSVILEVDHIMPVSKGGQDDIDNLVTACFDCNRGKSNKELTTMPQSTREKTEQLKEKEEQYEEYKKVLDDIKRREQLEIDIIDDIYSTYFPDWSFSDRFRNSSVRTFLKMLGRPAVESAMHTACGRINDEQKVLKYFCGICWNRINDIGNG